MSKNPQSHRLNISKGKTDTVDMADSKANPIPAPTPVECLKYGIPLEKAKIMHIKDLTLDDYMFLRADGGLNKKKIKALYGFPGDATFYKKMKDIGAFPEPVIDEEPVEVTKPIGISDKQEFVELGREVAEPVVVKSYDPKPVPTIVAESIPAPVQSEPVVQSFLPPRQTIITRHICPVCLEEFTDITAAETRLNGHASIVNIERTDGYNEQRNCPDIIIARLSDGHLARYSLVDVG